MTAEPGFALHPEAAGDITEIWEYIAQDNPLAARRVREEILSRIRAVVPFPHSATNGRILRHDPCASFWYVNT
jgi:plasmid stabilization system protein ParE